MNQKQLSRKKNIYNFFLSFFLFYYTFSVKYIIKQKTGMKTMSEKNIEKVKKFLNEKYGKYGKFSKEQKNMNLVEIIEYFNSIVDKIDEFPESESFLKAIEEIRKSLVRLKMIEMCERVLNKNELKNIQIEKILVKCIEILRFYL